MSLKNTSDIEDNGFTINPGQGKILFAFKCYDKQVHILCKYLLPEIRDIDYLRMTNKKNRIDFSYIK